MSIQKAQKGRWAEEIRNRPFSGPECPASSRSVDTGAGKDGDEYNLEATVAPLMSRDTHWRGPWTQTEPRITHKGTSHE